MYAVIFIDAINVKIREGQVANRPIYLALGVTVDGVLPQLRVASQHPGQDRHPEQQQREDAEETVVGDERGLAPVIVVPVLLDHRVRESEHAMPALHRPSSERGPGRTSLDWRGIPRAFNEAVVEADAERQHGPYQRLSVRATTLFGTAPTMMMTGTCTNGGTGTNAESRPNVPTLLTRNDP